MKDNIINKYDEEIREFGGYIYTINSKLSSQIANKRLNEAALKMLYFRNKKVLDIGCGDGTYTYEFFKRGKPKTIVGIDQSKEAIMRASQKYALNKNRIKFKVGNAYKLSFKKEAFDIAIFRGVLHHLRNPQKALKESLFIARTVLIIEPNGYNPFVKLVEKLSEYHISHQETSYYPFRIKKWINGLGAKIIDEKFINFVPFFCSDIVAIILKRIESFVENTPIFNKFLSSAYIIKITI